MGFHPVIRSIDAGIKRTMMANTVYGKLCCRLEASRPCDWIPASLLE